MEEENVSGRQNLRLGLAFAAGFLFGVMTMLIIAVTV